MSEARRVCNDSIGDEWTLGVWIWLDARGLEATQHFCYYLALLSNITR